MDPSRIFGYFGYAMAGLFLVLGGYVLFLLPEQFRMPEKFRMMFGTVLVLYGVYRIIATRIKQCQQDDEQHQHL